ncbi:hypothetical protein [Paenibacillus whitsoniae]|uniref:Uncharacterized protein n=1 Tax=Paenibacillus whitsoniae TaxID=2496558 RepID=A0A3S0CRN7_9BACL|nr:hypothetical protein [Paenibacillus whitsoniae]RTE05816.1 hypothetical protein EJQ19_24105 [Paenibacillus whitsoniae]
MMKYGAEHEEHQFDLKFREAEERGQWRDLYLDLTFKAGQAQPEDLEDPSVLVICNQHGDIVQIVLHDGGCDCEFQFTPMEKAQIEDFVAKHVSV